MQLSRRSFFSGLASSLVAASAIVSYANIMPVRALPLVTPDYSEWITCLSPQATLWDDG